MDGQRPVVVVGQGALGSFFGALLADQGRTVHVVSSRAGDPKTVELSVTGRRSFSGEVTLQGQMPDTPAGLALITTRAEHAKAAAEGALDAVAEAGAVACLQNGLVSLDIADALGTDAILPVVVGFNAKMRGPETVELTSRGGITTGALSEKTQPAAEQLVEAVRGPIPADLSSNPRGAVWSKWCISCAINGLAVVTGEGVGPVTETRLGREALISVVTECVDVATNEGVELTRVAGPFSPDTLAGNASTGLGGRLRRGVTWLIGRGYGDVVPSSLDAMQEGRDPEIEAINGTAVERGDANGVPTPWNRAIVSLTDEIQAGKREPGLEQLEELTERATVPPKER